MGLLFVEPKSRAVTVFLEAFGVEIGNLVVDFLYGGVLINQRKPTVKTPWSLKSLRKMPVTYSSSRTTSLLPMRKSPHPLPPPLQGKAKDSGNFEDVFGFSKQSSKRRHKER